MIDRELLEACAEAAHEAWLEEKVKRLRDLNSPTLSWPSEAGEEQLVHWDVLSEPVREFDRIVVGAIIETMKEKGVLPR